MKQSFLISNRPLTSFPAIRLLALVGMLISQSAVLAQTFTWDGGGGDDNFGTGANWVGDSSPSVGSGVVLQFTGSTRLTPNNNYTTGDNFGEWHLLSGAGGDFTISGNGFGLYNKVENDTGSGRAFTINTAGIYSRDGSIELNPVGGNLTTGGSIELDNNASLNVYDGNNSRTLTLNGALSNGNGSGGNGSLVLNQTATVILAADSDFGGTTINTGTTLRVGAGGGTGTLGSGNTLNNGSLIFNRTGSLSYAGILSGTGTLTKQAAGTVTLSGANTYSGITIITGGSLSINSDARLGTVPGAATPGSLVLNGGALAITTGFTLNVNRGIALGPTSGTGTGTIDVASAQTLTYAGIAANNGTSTSSLTKIGAGAVVFTAANTYSGGTTIGEGTISIGSGSGTSQVGSVGTGSITISNNATFRMNATGSIFPGNAINVVAGANALMESASASSGYGGTVSSGDSSSTLTINSGTVNFSAGNVKQFNSFLGTVNVPTGGTLEPRGTITTTGNGGDNTTFNVTGTGRIDTRNGGNMTLGALTGDGILSGPNGADGTLIYIVGTKGANTTFSGSILTGSTGARLTAVTKTGTGKLTLSGTALSYTGTTTVSGGTLNITGTKSGTGAVNVNSGGTLMGTGSVAGLTTVASGGKLSPGTSVGTLTLSSLTLASGSSITNEFNGTTNDLTVVSTSGGLTINGGSIQVFQENTTTPYTVNGTYNLFQYTGAIAGVGVSALSVANPQSGKGYAFGTAGGYVTLTISDGVAPFYWNVDADGSWGTGANWTGGTAPNSAGGFAGLGGVGTAITVPRAVSLDGTKTVGTLQFNNSSSAFTVAQGSGGSLSLDNSGSAAALNDLAGSHAISAPVALSANGIATAVSGAGDTLTVSGVISGSGGVTKTGTGALVQSGANTYSGKTTVSAGTLAIADETGLGGNPGSSTADQLTLNGGTLRATASLTLDDSNRGITLGASGGILSPDSSVSLTISNVIAGSGSLTKSGNGTVELTANNTYSGGTAINAGTVKLISNTGAGTGNITATGQLRLGNGVLITNGFTANQTFECLDVADAGATAIYAGTAANSGNGLRFQASGSGSTLIFSNATVNITASGKTFWPTRGNIVYAGNTSINNNNNTQPTLIGRSAGNAATLTIKDNAVLNCNAGFSMGEGGGVNSSLAFTLQDLALVNLSTATFNALNVGVSGVTLNLNGGTLAVGSITKGNATAETMNWNGTTIKANASSATFFPALSGLTVNIGNGGAVVDTAGFNIEIGAALLASGSGGLTKLSAGILTLGGASTYTGNTTISNGTLALGASGSIAATPNITVASGATFDVSAVSGYALGAGQTLKGEGTVTGAATINGTVAPGNSIGTLNFGTAPTLAGTVLMEISTPNNADKINVSSGTLNFGGTLTVTNIGALLTNGNTFDLFDGTLSGSFGTLNLPHGAAHWNTGDLNVGGSIFFTNVAPVAKNITAGVAQGGTVIVPVIGGKNGATDAEADSLSVIAVGAPSSGSASYGATNVTYVASGSAGTNTFTYTVTDAFGATDTKTVTVVVSSPVGFNMLSGPVNNGNGTFTLGYLGIPGLNYALDESPDLVAPYTWFPVLTNTASGTGSISYTVPLSYPSGSFRTRHVP